MRQEVVAFALAVIALAFVAYAALRASSRFFWTVMFVAVTFGTAIGVVHLIQRG